MGIMFSPIPYCIHYSQSSIDQPYINGQILKKENKNKARSYRYFNQRKTAFLKH